MAHLKVGKGSSISGQCRGPDVGENENHLEKRVLQVETCAEQGGVYCSQGQQTLKKETNWLFRFPETFPEISHTHIFQSYFHAHLHLLPPWLSSNIESPLLQLRQWYKTQSLICMNCIWNLFLNLLLPFLYNQYHLLTWWYSRMLPSLSDTVLMWKSQLGIFLGLKANFCHIWDTFDMISLTCFRTPAFCSFSSSRTFLQWCKAYQERESKINKSSKLQNQKLRSRE